MNPKIKDWRGLRVWVIGASSGIGAETARELLRRGAKVALSARNAAALRNVAGENAQAIVLPLDITDAASVLRARDELLAQWGGIDLGLVVAGGYQKMRAD
ncbi:MAG: SDR family NAD(P)-dependent oxidoreductase, partial [Gallionella sp.]|nr:SDR family NAD(P)-dependent oxidoreductase [Gallionella sp.]